MWMLGYNGSINKQYDQHNNRTNNLKPYLVHLQNLRLHLSSFSDHEKLCSGCLSKTNDKC